MWLPSQLSIQQSELKSIITKQNAMDMMYDLTIWVQDFLQTNNNILTFRPNET